MKPAILILALLSALVNCSSGDDGDSCIKKKKLEKMLREMEEANKSKVAEEEAFKVSKYNEFADIVSADNPLMVNSFLDTFCYAPKYIRPLEVATLTVFLLLSGTWLVIADLSLPRSSRASQQFSENSTMAGWPIK